MAFNILVSLTSALTAFSGDNLSLLDQMCEQVVPLLTDFNSDRLVLEGSLSELASSSASKSDGDEDLSKQIEMLFSVLLSKSDQLWTAKELSCLDFFESWLILADRVNLLSRSFHWIPYLAMDSYHKICIKQFQALQSTTKLISETVHVGRFERLSTPECRHAGSRLCINAPIQLLWLDLAQDAMIKFTEAQGEDTDGTVQEIKETAEKVKATMPKAIPRDHLYELSETAVRQYQQSLHDDVCLICFEKIASCVGERLHCEYSCGKFFHRKCMLTYLRTSRPNLQAQCPYGCTWPVLSLP